tara:strand:- start:23037 stop:23984 length:948 start_codon:yes stop_codon:yes gene_type:complete
MGSTKSKDVVNSAFETISRDNTSIYQDAAMDCNDSNTIDLVGCKAGTLVISQSGQCKLNLDDATKASISSSVSNDMTSQVKQVAKSISQNFNLNPGSTAADTISNLSQTAITDINSNITSKCMSSMEGINNFTCEDSDVKSVYINQTQASTAFSKCAMDSTSLDATKDKMSATIDQSATAVSKNAIAAILIAAAILVAAIAFLFTVGGSTIVLIVIALAVIALIAGVVWYYVHKHNSEKNNGAGCADCSIFTDEMKCEGAFCQWDGNACICPTNKDCSKQCPNFTDKNSCHDAKCEWVDKGSGPVCTGDKNDCRS